MKRTAPILMFLAVWLGPIIAPLRAEVVHYEIDAVHSCVDFKVRYLGLTWVNGGFTRFAGSIDFDSEDESNNQITMVAQAQSIDTRNKSRNEILRSEDFFNVAKFPTITFKSRALAKHADGGYTLTGDLTLLKTTRTITTRLGAPVVTAGPDGAQSLSVELEEIVVKRSDYGMKKMIGPIGDEVHLFLSFSAVQQSE